MAKDCYEYMVENGRNGRFDTLGLHEERLSSNQSPLETLSEIDFNSKGKSYELDCTDDSDIA
jgi:hypothetical protein